MRRLMTAVACAATAALLLTGCANPGGVDGDLVDDWAALADAEPFLPDAEVCHPQELVATVPLAEYTPVDCTEPHRTETVFVGTFTGAAAQLATPPLATSAEMRGAFTECDGKARTYVGDEWRAGRLRLVVSLPTPVAWTAGARWFRCDLAELAGLTDGVKLVQRTSSLRGALTADSSLRLRCYNTQAAQSRVMSATPVADCAEEHNSEFVGAWVAGETTAYPSRDADWAPFYDRCYRLVAEYVGVSEKDVRYRTGVVVSPAFRLDWQRGDRGLRCYLWRSDGKFTRSLKGAGEKGLPLRTG
jgi:hypothetical protein